MRNKSTSIFVFKTNIKRKKQLNEIRRQIDVEPQIIKWNVDFHDSDKLLRIESLDLHPAAIESRTKAGYYCEELKD
ncbi:MAG: hypothetical protein ABIO81_11110 [Ginsengibacter sp.]